MSAFWEIYLLRIQSSGVFLWSRDQAYLFVTVTSSGHHLSALRWPWLAIKASLGDLGDIMDSRGTLVVIRVTAAGVEKHTLELERTPEGILKVPHQLTPLEDRIYCTCILGSLGGLCRWEGDHFVRASQEEKEKFHRDKFPDNSLLTTDDFESDGHGWSRRVIAAGWTPEQKLATIVGDDTQLSIDFTGGDRTGAMSINLEHPGKASERVGYFEGLNGEMVSKTRYLKAFEVPK